MYFLIHSFLKAIIHIFLKKIRWYDHVRKNKFLRFTQNTVLSFVQNGDF